MQTQSPNDPEELFIAKSTLHFPVVGIGASAGGIAAMQRFLEGLPADPGMAFVVVMHLSPDHESSLGAIFQKSSRLKVVPVTENTRIEINHVYVISPALKLLMTDGQLKVSKLLSIEGRRQSIDLFFRSLALAHQERGVCVVLSGSGSDGAQGIKRIKELGGVALVQSPDEAEFDSMPLASIQTGAVDFILPIEEMPAKLAVLWRNAQRIELPSPPADLKVEPTPADAELLAEEALLSIKALLRERTGHDFSHYKRATVLRRLERRMQVNAVPDLLSYRRVLDTKPNETTALLQDMLISVTNFFRDPDAFSALEIGIRKLLQDRPAGEPFRVWIAGCATGEEAYSVAILLREMLGPGATPMQVFASDIDQRAVAFARVGLYPASIQTDVSAERLSANFTAETAGFRISKGVRDTVIFSAHNVLSDPPFTRMDLICCRNLLIYLDRSAQAQVLKGFHFALKPRGMLFLGSSETTDGVEGLFDGVDKAHRLYSARSMPGRARVLPPVILRTPSMAPLPAGPPDARQPMSPLETLHERVLRAYAPPTVLVDADLTVLHVSERAAHLLRLPEGAPTHHLLALARPELRPELRAALLRAVDTGQVIEAPRVMLTINGKAHHVLMSVRPAVDETPKGLMLIVFNEAQESLALIKNDSSLRDPVVESLEAELIRTQEQLRSTVGESASSTEELRASNEELQTINEELRSTTEELETSREELQAVNEELTTVNSELTLRIDDATKISDDLQNLMTSADIGTVFVDRDMRIKRFTPQAATLFNLLNTDTGRPLLDITHRLDYPQLSEDVTRVLRDLSRIEREVRSEDGRWFLARAVPYRTVEDRIEGAVLAFFDISSRLAAEELLRSNEQQMRMVAESMRDYAIITMDGNGIIASWSPGAERIFDFEAQEVIGKHFRLIFTEEDRAAGMPEEELGKARKYGRADDDRWHLRKGGERIFVSGITSPLKEARFEGFAKIARDFTKETLRGEKREAALVAEKEASSRLLDLAAMKDEFLAIVSHELKNPLSLIRMNAQLLERMPLVASDIRAKRSTAAIQVAVTSQAQIINDLLELSRANMGKVVLVRTVIEMSELIEGVVTAVADDARAKGINLKSDLRKAAVHADQVRVEQIVWNLVTNAIKFTPEGGEVHVSLGIEAEMVRLCVTDTGIGLDANNVGSVFEMFKQVDNTPSRRSQGLGIGLALVKQLTDLHGGRVQASSEGLGKGSSFYVWLPVTHGAGAIAHEVQGLGKVINDLRILLVDDETELLAAFGALLEGEGAQVTGADSAARALELANLHEFDVVISDIAMPQHDGYWLARQLRTHSKTRAIPLVAVSGMARSADRDKALAAGFNAHLGKPLDLSQLEDALQAALASKTK